MGLLNQCMPKFKYHPDPIGTGVIKKQDTECPVCNKIRAYVYVGPFYSVEEVEGICPWCIADGTAAEKFEGEFQDSASCEDVENNKFLEELVHRTPGYCGWQQEQWLSHCGDFCAFIGVVGWKEVKHLAGEISEDMERIKQNMGMTQEEFEKSLLKGGEHQGYLFRCVRCGQHRLTSDLG